MGSPAFLPPAMQQPSSPPPPSPSPSPSPTFNPPPLSQEEGVGLFTAGLRGGMRTTYCYWKFGLVCVSM